MNLLTIPNVITMMRMVGAIALCFVGTLSPEFFVIYTFCGITDVLDGFLARLLKQASEKGATLDSVADLLFYSIVMIKLIPVLWPKLHMILWIVAAVIVVVRIISYSTAAKKFHKFAALHTWMNKATGFLVFMTPYAIMKINPNIYCAVLATVAMTATVEELIIHSTYQEYNTNNKSVIKKLQKK